MLEAGVLYRIYYFSAGGTFVAGFAGIIVFNGFGAFIKSAGGEGISTFGTKRVNGFAHPARSKRESARIYFISQPPPSSKAFREV